MTKPLKFKILETEKSFLVRPYNTLVLSTKSYINQDDVVKYIEETFKTKVLKINSLVQKGKVKFRRRIKVQLPDRKKFYIKLDSLDKFEKVEKENVEAV